MRLIRQSTLFFSWSLVHIGIKRFFEIIRQFTDRIQTILSRWRFNLMKIWVLACFKNMRPQVDREGPNRERPLLFHHLFNSQIYLFAEWLQHVGLFGILVVLFLVGLKLTRKQTPCFVFWVHEFAQNFSFIFRAWSQFFLNWCDAFILLGN